MTTLLKDNNFRKILILAVLLRVLIMPFYLHPDIKTYNFQASFFGKGVLDIYTYLEQNKNLLPLKEEFVYFPLTYFFLGFYQTLASPFLGAGFEAWLYDASQSASEKVGVYRYLFILKLPYLFFDLGIAFLLMRFFRDPKAKMKVFTLWMFNPFSLVLIYVFSNVDVIPVFLSILGLLFVSSRRYVSSGLMLGIAASFKGFPLLYIPFFLCGGGSLRKKLLFFSLSSCVFIFILFLFWSESFKQAALVSGLTTRLLHARIDLGFGESVQLFVTLYVFFIFAVFASLIRKIDIAGLLVLLLITLFSLIHFHIQWILWILPFLAIMLVTRPGLLGLTVFWLSIGFAIPFLYNDKAMSIGLLMPISHLFDLLFIPFQLTQRVYDPLVIQGVLHSIFAAVGMIIGWKILQSDKL